MSSSSATYRPRVILVTTWFPTSTNPTSGIFVQRDATALTTVANVHVIHLVNPRMFEPATSHENRPYRLTRIPLDLKNPLSLLRAAQAIRPYLATADVLHTHAMSTLIPLRLLTITTPWVHTEHWSGYVDWNTGWRHLIRSAMARLATRPDIVVSVSSVLAQTIEALSHRAVRVIPNIVQWGKLTDRPHYTTDRPLRIVAVGNLIPRKRPVLAAQTCRELNDRGVPTELTWVGDGPLRDDLLAYCQEHNVALNLPGVVAAEDIADYFASADLSIFPTSAETFGLVGAEALAAGRPLVAGANGGQRDFVEFPSGVLVAAHTASAYADAVEKVMHDTAGLSAHDIASSVRKRFSAGNLATQYHSIYCELAGITASTPD